MSIRAWRGNLKERHQRLVNTSVNTPEGVSQVYGSSLVNSKDLQFTRPLPSRSGAEEGTRTLTPLSWQRTLSRSGAHPPSGSVHGVESFLADRHLRGLSPSTCRFYGGYLRRFVNTIEYEKRVQPGWLNSSFVGISPTLWPGTIGAQSLTNYQAGS